MNASEIALHLPQWVIPEGEDLDHLRSATEQLIAEFSRPIRLVRQAASQSSSWSYSHKGNLDRTKWFEVSNGIPRVYLCHTAEQLRNGFDFTRVLQATIPYGSWVCEDSLLHNLLSAGEIIKFSVKTRRAIRLEWLNKLKEKLNER